MNKKEILSLAIIAASFIIGIYFYSQLPEKIATHWDASGQVNGYGNKFWGVFLLPIISLAIFLLFLLIPKIDPLKENIKQFQKYFDGFILCFVLFLFYIHILVILANKGMSFNMSRFMLLAMGFLFYYAGILMEKAKRNWFIGVRTPWTLSSENVWNKTNKLGGKLFKISAVFAFLGILAPKFMILFIIAPLLLAIIYLFVYSYLEYKKET